MGHFRNSSKGKSISLFQLHWSTFGDLALRRSRGLFLVNRVDYGHALLIFHLQHVSLITRSGMDGETILGELKELVEAKVGGNLVVNNDVSEWSSWWVCQGCTYQQERTGG